MLLLLLLLVVAISRMRMSSSLVICKNSSSSIIKLDYYCIYISDKCLFFTSDLKLSRKPDINTGNARSSKEGHISPQTVKYPPKNKKKMTSSLWRKLCLWKFWLRLVLDFHHHRIILTQKAIFMSSLILLFHLCEKKDSRPKSTRKRIQRTHI